MRTLIALALLAAGVQADVLKVADTGGTHVSIQAAIDDAVDGDIVIIDLDFNPLSPRNLIVDGKGLTLIGEGEVAREVPPLLVRDVPSSSQVVLRNLAIQSNAIAVLLGGTLAVRDCVGPVLVEDCLVQGGLSSFDPTNGLPGLYANASQRLALTRTQCVGGIGRNTLDLFPFPVFETTNGGPGVLLLNSRAAVYDCTLAGGTGGEDAAQFGVPGGRGGEALTLANSQVWLVGTTLTGGSGGTGSPNGSPAPAVFMEGATSGLRDLDSDMIGGAGLAGEPDAPPIVTTGGIQVVWPGEAITLGLPAPARPGDAAAISVDGPANTLFGLFTSFGAGFLPKTNLHGVVLGDLGTFGGPLFVSNIPPSGHFELPFTVPTLGGLEGFIKVDQVISSQGTAGLVLSNPSTYIHVENGL